MNKMEKFEECPLFNMCNYKTAVCRVTLPDDSCYWYRYFKTLIKKDENNMQETTDIERALHTPTNFDWIRTLTVEEFVNWYYDFWNKEQNKYNSSRGALTWWLSQMHDSNGEADQYIKSISKDTGINFNEEINN